MNEDCLLVEAIKSGDADKFEELVERYKDKLYNMACRFTGDTQEGQDLAQEIFVNIYKNLGSFKGQSTLSTWIYRVSLNRCLDWKRKKQRRYTLNPLVLTQKDDELNILDRLPSTTANPEEQYLKNEQSQELHRAIGCLPDKYQKIIVLYHFQQLTYQEIGSILDLPVRTVETQLYRAKSKLKQILGKHMGKEVKSYEVIRT